METRVLGGWAYSTEFVSSVVHSLPESSDAFWLVGWSLGGMQALDAVISGKMKPKGLILISSTAKFCADGEYTCGVNRAVLRSMKTGIKRDRNKTLQSFYAGSLFPRPPDDQLLMDRIKQANEFTTEQLGEGLDQLDSLDLRGKLSEVDIPVLILHGEQDRIIPVEAGRYLQHHIRGSQIHTHPESGHEILITHPKWSIERIFDFIRT